MALEVSEGTGRAVSVLRWSGDEGRSAKAAFQSGFIGMLAFKSMGMQSCVRTACRDHVTP